MKLQIEHSVSRDLQKFLTDLITVLSDLAETLTNNQEIIMADLSALKDEVSSLGNVVDATVRVIDGLVEYIKNTAAETISQEEIDSIVSEIESNKQALAEAVAAAAARPNQDLPGDQPSAGQDLPDTPNQDLPRR